MSSHHFPFGRRHWGALLCGLLVAAAAVFVYLFFLRTAEGQFMDAASFAVVYSVHAAFEPWLDPLRVAIPALAGLTMLCLLIAAAMRRRFRALLAPIALVAAVGVASEVLKDVLPRPRLGDYGYDYNTFPSGHAAVTVALLIGSQWLLGPTLRRLALLPFIVLGVASGCLQIVAFTHRFSDVLGGALLAALAAVLLRGRPRGWRSTSMLWAVVLLSAGVGVLGIEDWVGVAFGNVGFGAASLGMLACVTSVVVVAFAAAGESGILATSRSRPESVAERLPLPEPAREAVD